MKVKLAVISTIFILSSCLGTRYLQEGETILRKQKVHNRGVIDNEDAESLKEQTPNTRLFIFPFTHLVYLKKIGEKHFDSAKVVAKMDKIEAKYDSKIATAKNEKKRSSLLSRKIRKTDKKQKKLDQGNLLMRFGEDLSVFDSTKLEQTKINFENYMFAHGYFDAKMLTKNVSSKNQKTTVNLRIQEEKPYVMDSIIYVIKDEKVDSLFRKNIDGALLKGKKYDQDLISAERERVYNLLSDNGYYDFKRQYQIFEIDTTALDQNRLIIKEIIGNPPNKKNHKVFKIDSVIFTANPNNSYQKRRKPSNYNNVTYVLNNNRFYERVVDWRVFIYPDDLYNKSAVVETQKQLSYLDMFKFVNVNYDTTGGKFIANIFTSPLNKYQTSIEGGLSVLDNAKGFPGPFVNFNAKNRNLFKGMEILEFNGTASIQGINNVDKNNATSRYSRLQYGGNISLTLPQFLFPIKDSYKAKIGQYNPKTRFSLGVNFEDRFGEFVRTTFNSSMRYLWQASDNSRITFTPLDIGYILSNNSPEFNLQLQEQENEGNISYVSAFRKSFISSAALAVDFNFNNYGIGNKDASFLHAEIEYGGIAQLLFGDRPIRDSLTYYKYLKGNIDYRQNIKLDNKTAFAYRANVGIAFVYGESKSLPYEKYYFAGGSNSIRAWQPRRLGPGSYAEYNRDDNGDVILNDNGIPDIDDSREQPGDILIELSAELRREFIGIIDYAIFVDAGNAWLWRSKTIETSQGTNSDPQGDDGVFQLKNFISEMAVGAGAGLRLDFSFLIMRLDAAYKVYDPGRAKGERFVLDELNFKNLGPLSKMNLNLGIGYPF